MANEKPEIVGLVSIPGHVEELTKKDLAQLKSIMVQIEQEYCRDGHGEVTKRQHKDKRLKLLYRILGYEQ